MTDVIVELATYALRYLCLLRVGNGNDVDLKVVAQYFHEICLVDLGETALARCIFGLSESGAMKAVLNAGVDLSGILAELDSLQKKGSASDAEVTAVILAAREASLGVGLGKRGVVVSTCQILPLLDSAAIALGSCKGAPVRCKHPLMLAVRDGNLALLGKVTSRGGSTMNQLAGSESG